MAKQVVLADVPVAWDCDSVEELQEAQRELVERGFRADVSASKPAPSEDVVWHLRVNAEDDPDGVQSEVVAHVGDRLLLANGILRKLSVDELEGMTK